nr:MAG TPA: hypothetical protein [Caudoviricetes sp.]
MIAHVWFSRFFILKLSIFIKYSITIFVLCKRGGVKSEKR